MTLQQFKTHLENTDHLKFQLPDGSWVPSHFHVTEVGLVSKHFIDCGGTVRTNHAVNLQLWEANDFDHRLAPEKLLQIIGSSEAVLSLQNHEIEVEYQGKTIEKYNLDFNKNHFQLTSKFTDCLAKDHCGIPENQMPQPVEQNACTPGSGCC